MTDPTHSRESLALRLVWMLVFLLVWLGAQYLLAAVVLAQLAWRLVKGAAHPGLADFGAALARYLAQLVAFGTFASETKPWPCADWPATSAPDDQPAPAP